MRKHIDLFHNTLASSITSSQTTITLTDASALGTVTAPEFIPLTIFNAAGDFETVHVTGIASNTLTVIRGCDNTTNQAWPNTTTIECRLTATAIDTKTSSLSSMYATLPGAYSVFTGKARLYPRANVTLTKVSVVSGAPVTVTDSTFQININGSPIFTTPKPTILIGNYTSTPLTISVDVTPSDYITIDCLTSGGSDAVVRIDYEPTE